MESFGAMKGKRNGSEISLSELMGEGGSTRVGARQKAFSQVDAEIAVVLEEWSGDEENAIVVEALETLRTRIAALEHGLPKVGKREKNGVVKVVHLVCISKSGNRIYVKDLGDGMLEALQESFVSAFGFKAKKEALAYVDSASMLGAGIKMF